MTLSMTPLTGMAELTRPTSEQAVRYGGGVENLAGDEIDQLSGCGRGTGGIKAGARGQDHRTRVVQCDEVLQVASGHRGLAWHDHDRAAFLEVHLGGAL